MSSSDAQDVLFKALFGNIDESGQLQSDAIPEEALEQLRRDLSADIADLATGALPTGVATFADGRVKPLPDAVDYSVVDEVDVQRAKSLLGASSVSSSSTTTSAAGINFDDDEEEEQPQVHTTSTLALAPPPAPAASLPSATSSASIAVAKTTMPPPPLPPAARPRVRFDVSDDFDEFDADLAARPKEALAAPVTQQPAQVAASSAEKKDVMEKLVYLQEEGSARRRIRFTSVFVSEDDVSDAVRTVCPYPRVQSERVEPTVSMVADQDEVDAYASEVLATDSEEDVLTSVEDQFSEEQMREQERLAEESVFCTPANLAHVIDDQREFYLQHPALLPVALRDWESRVIIKAPEKPALTVQTNEKTEKKKTASAASAGARAVKDVRDWKSELVRSSFSTNLAALYGPWDEYVKVKADDAEQAPCVLPLYIDLNDEEIGIGIQDIHRIADASRQSLTPSILHSKFSHVSLDSVFKPLVLHDTESLEEQFGDIAHPICALRLEREFFPTVVTRPIARFLLRPRFNWLNIDPTGRMVSDGALVKLREGKDKKRIPVSQMKAENITARSGRVVLVEYREEHPALLSLPSMGSRIRNFYLRKHPLGNDAAAEARAKDKKSAKDKKDDKSKDGAAAEVRKESEEDVQQFARLRERTQDGSLEAVDSVRSVPFLTYAWGGETVSVLETHMASAELVQQDVPQTDFLLIWSSARGKNGKQQISIREIDGLYAANYQQAHPSSMPYGGEVPPPSNRARTQFERARVLHHLYRLLEQNMHRDEEGRVIHTGDYSKITSALPDIEPATVRRICSDDCDIVKSVVKWKPERAFPNEKKIIDTLSPEYYARHVSMEFGISVLEDKGIDGTAAQVALLRQLYAGNKALHAAFNQGASSSSSSAADASNSTLDVLTREDQRVIAAVQHELKTAPWTSSATFVRAAREATGDVRFADLHFVGRSEVADAQRRFASSCPVTDVVARKQLLKRGFTQDQIRNMTPAERVRQFRELVANGVQVVTRRDTYHNAMVDTLRHVLGSSAARLRPSAEDELAALDHDDTGYYETQAAPDESNDQQMHDAEELAELERLEMEVDDDDQMDDDDEEDGEDGRDDDAMSHVSKNTSLADGRSSRNGASATDKNKRPIKLLRRIETVRDPMGRELRRITEITDPVQIDMIRKRQETMFVLRELLKDLENGGSSMVRSSMVRNQIRDLKRKEKERRRLESTAAMEDQRQRRCKKCGQLGHIASNARCPLNPRHHDKYVTLPTGEVVQRGKVKQVAAAAAAAAGGAAVPPTKGKGGRRKKKLALMAAARASAGTTGVQAVAVASATGGLLVPSASSSSLAASASMMSLDEDLLGPHRGWHDDFVVGRDENGDIIRNRDSGRAARTTTGRLNSLLASVVTAVMDRATLDPEKYGFVGFFWSNPLDDLRDPINKSKLSDYKRLIRKPMYLQLVLDSANKMRYITRGDMLADVDLMVQNAKLFCGNYPEFAIIVDAADKIRGVFDEEMAKHEKEFQELEAEDGITGLTTPLGRSHSIASLAGLGDSEVSAPRAKRPRKSVSSSKSLPSLDTPSVQQVQEAVPFVLDGTGGSGNTSAVGEGSAEGNFTDGSQPQVPLSTPMDTDNSM